MSQEFLLADASVSGDADDPTNAHGAADGTFTTDIDNESWTHRWGFANPTTDDVVDETTAAVLRLTVRKQDGTGDPDIDSIELFDSTGSIVTVSTGWSVTNSSSEEITISGIPWTTLTDTSGDTLEVQIVTSAAGGAPSVRAAVQVDEIRLDVTMVEASIPGSASPAVIAIGSTTPGFVTLNGTTDSVKTTDKAALDVTGDIELIALVALDDWTHGTEHQTLISKFDSPTERSFVFAIDSAGRIRMRWTTDGATAISETSEIIGAAAVDGEHLWIRCTFDVDDGASDYLVSYFYSADPINTAVGSVSWTTFGTDDGGGGGATSIFSSTSPVELGAINDGGGDFLDGKLYGAWVYDGIGGTRVANPDFRNADQGDWSSPPQSDDDSNSWTFESGASWTAPVSGAFAMGQVTPTNSDSGAGSASPAATVRFFTVDAVTPVGPAVDVQDLISRSFTVDAAAAVGAGVDVQALIARAFAVNAPTTAGAGRATLAAIARAFTLGGVTPAGAAIDVQDLIARVFVLAAVTTSNTDGGAGTASPAAIIRAFALGAPTLVGGAVDVQALISRAFALGGVTPVGAAVDVQDLIARAFALGVPTLAGVGVDVQDVIARAFALDAVTTVGPAVVAQAVIARAFALDLVTTSNTDGAPGTATPEAIARAFTVDAVTPRGAGVDVQALIARSFTLGGVTLLGPGVDVQDVIARSFALDAVTVLGAALVTPSIIVLVFTVDAVTTSTGPAPPAVFITVVSVSGKQRVSGVTQSRVSDTTPSRVSGVSKRRVKVTDQDRVT